jgi:hypothetical protein
MATSKDFLILNLVLLIPSLTNSLARMVEEILPYVHSQYFFAACVVAFLVALLKQDVRQFSFVVS